MRDQTHRTRDESRREAQGRMGVDTVRAAIRAVVTTIKTIVETLLSALLAVAEETRELVRDQWVASATDPVYAPAARAVGSMTLRGYLRAMTRPAGVPWAAAAVMDPATALVVNRGTGGAGTTVVVTSLTVTLASAGAPTAAVVTATLYGAEDSSGPVLWRAVVSLPAVAGSCVCVPVTGWIEAPANAPVHLQTTTPSANVTAAGSMSGFVLTV